MFKHGHIPYINTVTPNRVADFEKFHLSYNPSSADYGSDTTALVLGNNMFLILNGSHEEAMYAAAEDAGLQGCFDYFVENIALANPISDHTTVVDGDPNFGLDKYAVEVLGEDNVQRLRDAILAQRAAAAD